MILFVEMIGELARIEPDARIASILNKNEHRTAHGKSWTAKRVCSVRSHHAISVYRQGEQQDRGEISVRETADALGVTPTTIFRLIQLKQLPATQICGNAPWILLKKDVELYRETRNRSTPHQLLIQHNCSLRFNDIRRSASCRILEKQLCLPALLVDLRDGQERQRGVAGQKHQPPS
jgi:hypothetical protein